MFVLSLLYDTIPIEPVNLLKPYKEYLQDSIEKLYVDHVIADVGLVIAFYDFVSIEEAKIYSGDGRAHCKVSFRMIFFQPSLGEILQGTVIKNDSLGLQVSLEFFNDIRIVSNLLREPKSFDKNDNTWYWDFDGHQLKYLTNSIIRFRVVEVRYNKKERPTTLNNEETTVSQKEVSPMTILGSVAEDGLGLRCWWQT